MYKIHTAFSQYSKLWRVVIPPETWQTGPDFLLTLAYFITNTIKYTQSHASRNYSMIVL